MLEELCKTAFFDQCMAVVEDERPLARLKGRPAPVRRFDGFMSWDSQYFTWDGDLVKRRMRNRPGDALPLAMRYFDEHQERICDAYIRDALGGDLPTAMQENGTFDRLFGGFLAYFADRRNQLLSDTKALILEMREALAKQHRMPQSHGGVANLLKVLTQTMKTQGSSIQTIAKVQYAVCMQAGIFIPDEFIFDVLVAADIAEGDAKT